MGGGVLNGTRQTKGEENVAVLDRPIGGSLRFGIPFSLTHVGILFIPLVGWSAISVAVAGLLYVVRSLGVTVVYHRGMTHRSFRMPRAVQAIGATVAASA